MFSIHLTWSSLPCYILGVVFWAKLFVMFQDSLTSLDVEFSLEPTPERPNLSLEQLDTLLSRLTALTKLKMSGTVVSDTTLGVVAKHHPNIRWVQILHQYTFRHPCSTVYLCSTVRNILQKNYVAVNIQNLSLYTNKSAACSKYHTQKINTVSFNYR